MSPYIRSMLENAADDNGRPVTTDLDRIRAAARRTVWRRRGLVGAGGLGVVAVVTSVALLVPPVGGTSGDPAGSPGSAATKGPGDTTSSPIAPPVGPWGVSPLLDPLFEAIEVGGYEVDVSGSSGTMGIGEASDTSDGPVESAGAVDRTVTMTDFPVTDGDARGAVVVAEFTDVQMLPRAAVFGDLLDEPPPAGQQCAVLPPGAGDSDFAWTECEKQPLAADAEVWRARGGGPDADGLGVTLVRADGTGLSITVSTAAFSYAGGTFSYGYEPLPTVEPSPPLEEVPLTHDVLAEIVVTIASSGTVFPVADPSDAGAAPPESAAACSTGAVRAEIVDDAGRSALVEVDGRIYACSFGTEPDELLDVMDVTDWPPFGGPLEAWQFGLGSVTRCESAEPCGSEVRLGVGPVPEGVARITFEVADGQITDAKIAAGIWIFRYVEPAKDPYDPAPIIVRVYDAAGALLVEGDEEAPPPSGPPPPPPTLPPAPPAP